MRASSVCWVGSRMSRSRLCVRISNCSRDFLSVCGDRSTQPIVNAGTLYGPGKAANAGGVAVSGLEMAQDSLRMAWPAEEVDARPKQIMKAIHQQCRDTAEAFDVPGNYVHGANIAGFVKVADAMLDQGLV